MMKTRAPTKGVKVHKAWGWRAVDNSCVRKPRKRSRKTQATKAKDRAHNQIYHQTPEYKAKANARNQVPVYKDKQEARALARYHTKKKAFEDACRKWLRSQDPNCKNIRKDTIWFGSEFEEKIADEEVFATYGGNLGMNSLHQYLQDPKKFPAETFFEVKKDRKKCDTDELELAEQSKFEFSSFRPNSMS